MIFRLLKRALGWGQPPGSPEGHAHVDMLGPFTRFTITDTKGVPYLTRWYLLKTKWLKIYLHCIYGSDPDRDLHDHPWAFVSFLLKGSGYMEHQPDGSIKRYYALWGGAKQRFMDLYGTFAGPNLLRNDGFINARRDPSKPHRLQQMVEGEPLWTLLIVGPRRRDWGFHVTKEMAERASVTGGRSNHVEGRWWVDHKTFIDINKEAVCA